MNPQTNNPQNKTARPSGGRFFDVMRPGSTPAPATSRPVIVGHRPQMRDGMLNSAGPSAPAASGRSRQVLSGGHLDIKPMGAKPVLPSSSVQVKVASPARPAPVASRPVTPAAPSKVLTSAPASAPRPEAIAPPKPEVTPQPSVTPSTGEAETQPVKARRGMRAMFTSFQRRRSDRPRPVDVPTAEAAVPMPTPVPEPVPTPAPATLDLESQASLSTPLFGAGVPAEASPEPMLQVPATPSITEADDKLLPIEKPESELSIIRHAPLTTMRPRADEPMAVKPTEAARAASQPDEQTPEPAVPAAPAEDHWQPVAEGQPPEADGQPADFAGITPEESDTPSTIQAAEQDMLVETSANLKNEGFIDEPPLTISGKPKKSYLRLIIVLVILVLFGLLVFDVLLDASIVTFDGIPHTHFFDQ